MATPPRKHVVVIGGGLVGVATANSLAREGADVTVIERGPSVALGTSFGNAGRFAVTALLDGPISSPSAAYRTLWSFISRPFTSTGVTNDWKLSLTAKVPVFARVAVDEALVFWCFICQNVP
jgi:glycine/D-amino acid oxidase-like deaminating enzyme